MLWLSDFLRETTTMTHSYTMSASHPFAGRFFLCHQKIAAGSMARLLKIELQKRGSKFTTFATWTISRWFRGTSLARFWGENVERGGLNMSKLNLQTSQLYSQPQGLCGDLLILAKIGCHGLGVPEMDILGRTWKDSVPWPSPTVGKWGWG